MPELKTRWDIFCTVVDNFGDIGVTWRLARQLVAEHGLAVRLWVDDLRAFERLCPEIDTHAVQQWQQGVEVRQWPAEWQPTEA
ncbi:elongation factor P maturation arginine rhamnosyltransferase EarP, partial [Pseudomonas sp. GM55]|uniref:elongation factor P maturation arginine rhamnosyltransferase EarP n=1 Tax=Pseudomonas sp. GM55 TaxID=1144333 RepID=UPI0002706805